MDAEIKKQWIEALRSGKYEQGRETLCQVVLGPPTEEHPDGAPVRKFCCLGVLCDVIDSSKWLLPEPRLAERPGFGAVPYKDPDERADYARVGMPTPHVYRTADLNQRQAEKVADMNDSYSNTFAEIADFVEKEY